MIPELLELARALADALEAHHPEVSRALRDAQTPNQIAVAAERGWYKGSKDKACWALRNLCVSLDKLQWELKETTRTFEQAGISLPKGS